MAPIGLASFLEHDSASRPRREDALAQRLVEAFNMIGFSSQLADGSVRRDRNHPCVYHVLIGVEHGMLTVGVRNLDPQPLRTPTTAITDMKGHHLVCPG